MNKSLYRLIILSLCLWLSACASLSTPSVAQNQNLSWSEREQSLAAFKNWNIDGKIALRTASDAETANLSWKQNDQDYTLYVFGPLGASAFKLVGNAQGVTLSNPEGQQFFARTPESLLASQAQWHVPVSHLYYWIRGLPAPGIAAKKEFDAYHHLTTLEQQGWKIHYLAYTSVGHVDLPNKIFLESPELQVKIIIHAWQL